LCRRSMMGRCFLVWNYHLGWNLIHFISSIIVDKMTPRSSKVKYPQSSPKFFLLKHFLHRNVIKVDIDDINKYEKNSNLLATLPGNIGKKKTGYLFKVCLSILVKFLTFILSKDWFRWEDSSFLCETDDRYE